VPELFVGFGNKCLHYWYRVCALVWYRVYACLFGLFLKNRQTHLSARLSLEYAFPEKYFVDGDCYLRAPLNLAAFQFTAMIFYSYFCSRYAVVDSVQFPFYAVSQVCRSC